MNDTATKLAARTETTFSIRYPHPDTGQMVRDRYAVQLCEYVLRWIPEVDEVLEIKGTKLIRRLGTGDWLTRVQLSDIVDYLDAARTYYLHVPREEEPYLGRNDEATRDINRLTDLVLAHD